MSKSILNILVAAGGTGGHLFPAIATVDALQKQSSVPIKSFFVGNSERLEARIVPSLGHEFTPMPIRGLTKKLSLQALSLPFKIWKSISICKKIIKDRQIDAVLCTGAYLSYPAGIAANKCNVPLILMESNVSPGKTIAMLAPKANLIISSFEISKEFFPIISREKIVCFGNPVRSEILSAPAKEDARKALSIPQDKRVILVFGGSLGARAINMAMELHIHEIINKGFYVIWQTGKNYSLPVNLKKDTIVKQNSQILEFIDDMASVYAASDIVVARSGATTVAELAVTAKPSILVPLPSASNNEQQINAEVFVKAGAALLIDNLSIEREMGDCVIELMDDPERLDSMSRAAATLARKNAAGNAATAILKLINGL